MWLDWCDNGFKVGFGKPVDVLECIEIVMGKKTLRRGLRTRGELRTNTSAICHSVRFMLSYSYFQSRVIRVLLC